MKVAVYGAGGVGGYFGGRLAQAGADVHFVARGAHLAALRQRGLVVRSTLGDFEAPVAATDNPADIGVCDFVLFCVKAYDTESAAATLSPMLGEHTAILSLQNGVENETLIGRVVGPGRMMGGAAFILSTIDGPGTIAHTAGPARIVFGEFGGGETDRARSLLGWFEKAGVNAELSLSIESVLWDKFAYICAHAGMTATSRLPLGDLRPVPESWAMFRRLSEEVCQLATGEGIALPANAVEQHLAFAASLEPGTLSSLHYDLVHEKPMELEALHGTVVRFGGARRVPVPMNEAVYALLKPYSLRYGS